MTLVCLHSGMVSPTGSAEEERGWTPLPPAPCPSPLLSLSNPNSFSPSPPPSLSVPTSLHLSFTTPTLLLPPPSFPLSRPFRTNQFYNPSIPFSPKATLLLSSLALFNYSQVIPSSSLHFGSYIIPFLSLLFLLGPVSLPLLLGP